MEGMWILHIRILQVLRAGVHETQPLLLMATRDGGQHLSMEVVTITSCFPGKWGLPYQC